tara:strand:- start:793 stop:1362 length:570 start_codon:yes stop_codon:yes gene_type:complete
MDIGFGSLIEKFEEYVGKRPTRLLIIVIFAAVFAFCAKAITDNLIEPILRFFRTPIWGSTLVEIAFLAGATAAGITGGIYAMASFTQWQAAKLAMAKLKQAQTLRKVAKNNAGEANAVLDQSSGMLNEVESLSSKNLAMAKILLELVKYYSENPTEFSEEKLKEVEAFLNKYENELSLFQNEETRGGVN